MENLNLSIAQQVDLIARASTHYQAEEYAEARVISDQLLAAAPQDHAALHLAGAIAIGQGRLPEAAELLKLALKRAPDTIRTALSWNALGKALHKANDLRQAEEAHRRAVRFDPNNCDYLVELANTYSDGRKNELAMETLQVAINRFFADPEPCIALGNLLHKCSRHEDALIAYDMAIARMPESASAHMCKGSTLKTLGRFMEAEAEMREGLRLDPMIRGYTELVQVSKQDIGEQEMAAIKKRLNPGSGAPLVARVDAMFALAKLYDDKGDYATAFKYLDEGCHLHRSTLNYSIIEHQQMIDGIIMLFTPDFIARYEGMSTSELAPIFIVGMPRSGTTLTEQIVASHSQVQPGGELMFMSLISKDLGQTWEDRGETAPGDDATVANDLNQGAANYAESTANLWKGSPHMTDKLPMNFMYIGIIHFLFPKAKIIYCRRNPAATCFSNLQNLFGAVNVQYSYDLKELGQFYKLHERIMAHWNKVLPGRILTVDYEKMVEDHENQVHRLLEFCGLEFEPACLDFHTLKRPVATASFAQVRKPIYKGSLDHWKNYEPYLGPLLETLGMKPSGSDPA